MEILYGLGQRNAAIEIKLTCEDATILLRPMDMWHKILTTAIHTPSPHNTQPWRVRIIDEQRAHLYMERARMLPDEDTTGSFLLSAMGMFLESLTILAACEGRQLTYRLSQEPQGEALVSFAELELAGNIAQDTTYPPALFLKRATSRMPSNGTRMTPEVAQKLAAFAPAWGQQYSQIDDPAIIATLIDENIRAIFVDLNLPKYHDEIAPWFRATDRQAVRHADGLDHRCMRLSKLEIRIMKDFPQAMVLPVLRQIMHWSYRRRLGAVTHIGMISGPFFDSTVAVHSGRFLIRFWLELAKLNLYIHPFGNLVTNDVARQRVRTLTGIDNIWLIFRIGYTDPPPLSHRRTVEQVLLND